MRCVYFEMAFFFLFRISVEGHIAGSTPHHRHACISVEISVVSLVGSKQRHRTCDFCLRCAFDTLGRTCSGWPKNCWRWRTRLRTIWLSREILHSAKILVGVEMLLQPSMYVLGLVLGLGHSMQHSVWEYLPYLIQISTIIFSYWVQVKTLKKSPSQHIVVNFLETEKVVGSDTRVPKLLTHVAMNYYLYWAGMGATLVAGQSFSMWTHDDQGKWVKAWIQVPAVGDVTGALFSWLSVPVIVTIYAVINYGILVFALLLILFENQVDLYFMDLGNLPLFSAFVEKRDEARAHVLRHLRMCLIAGPHIWVKTSLLAMSWQSSSRFENANIMVPLFLTMGSKVYSQFNVIKNWICAELPNDFRDATAGDRCFMLFICLFSNTPALFVTACVFKLVGIFACPTTHLLNLTSGRVE